MGGCFLAAGPSAAHLLTWAVEILDAHSLGPETSRTTLPPQHGSLPDCLSPTAPVLDSVLYSVDPPKDPQGRQTGGAFAPLCPRVNLPLEGSLPRRCFLPPALPQGTSCLHVRRSKARVLPLQQDPRGGRLTKGTSGDMVGGLTLCPFHAVDPKLPIASLTALSHVGKCSVNVSDAYSVRKY